MKSAYELAMERLSAAEPAARALTPEQKQELAEIDVRHRAKLAEREIFLSQQLIEVRAAGDAAAIEQVEQQIRSERLRIEEERESAKEAVRRR